MKNKVLTILNAKVAGAEDNLYRANMTFRNMSSKELKQEYGMSGRTCGEILHEAQTQLDDLKKCVEWVKNAN